MLRQRRASATVHGKLTTGVVVSTTEHKCSDVSFGLEMYMYFFGKINPPLILITQMLLMSKKDTLEAHI